jgi:hypothetical protein
VWWILGHIQKVSLERIQYDEAQVRHGYVLRTGSRAVLEDCILASSIRSGTVRLRFLLIVSGIPD